VAGSIVIGVVVVVVMLGVMLWGVFTERKR
jgi:hypothetical protein